MFTPTSSVVRPRAAALGLIIACVALAGIACDDTTTPPPAPTGIDIVSGDAQYSKKGTELEEPVTVHVSLPDGEPAPGVEVRFQVIEGAGSVSAATAMTSTSGEASARWTMGPAVGLNRLGISLVDNSSLTVVATATSSEFYCPEEDPTFARRFSAAHNLFLLSRDAGALEVAGEDAAGVVYVELDLGNLRFQATAFERFDETVSHQVAVRDCAFAASGDFYATRNSVGNDVVKFASDGTPSYFAMQESNFGSEIDATSGGILVGCDALGPFVVTCRDTLYRWTATTYSGVYPDAANNDAVATNPDDDDLYFIYLGDRALWRVPLDGLAPTGPPEKVVTLERAEADGASGMVVNDSDGVIYILVESPTVKAILKVTPAGTKTVEFDFFTRGAGDAAGQQSDLAIDRSFDFLYTLDTRNNVILIYQLVSRQLSELVSIGDPNAASNGSVGERVGLSVLP
jgi:hypothetical protein